MSAIANNLMDYLKCMYANKATLLGNSGFLGSSTVLAAHYSGFINLNPKMAETLLCGGISGFMVTLTTGFGLETSYYYQWVKKIIASEKTECLLRHLNPLAGILQ